MFTIPEARENMTKAELRKLVVEMADLIISDHQDKMPPHPLDTHVQDRMEEGLQKAQETLQERPKWTRGKIKDSPTNRSGIHLTNRQGIQWPIEKLDERMRAEILEDDPTLLESLT